jgi:hypothetical protein
MKDLVEYHDLEQVESNPLPLETDGDRDALADFIQLLKSLEDTATTDVNADIAGQRLCAVYANSATAARAQMRRLVTPDLSWALLSFARRCATLARRAGNPEVLSCSLTALAVAGLRHGDARDTLVVLSGLWKVAVDLHWTPTDAFAHAARLAGPSMKALLTDFAAHSAGSVKP